MKRWTLRITLCIILFSGGGVVSSVGVAWFFAYTYFPQRGLYQQKYLSQDGLGWLLITYEAPGAYLNVVSPPRLLSDNRTVPSSLAREDVERFSDDHVPRWARHPVDYYFAKHNPPSETSGYDGAFGWPMICAKYEIDNAVFLDGSNPPVATAHWAIDTGTFPDSSMPRALPLRPILPGFIINTLFYAAVWFVLIFGWRAHLRLVRRWQGYCPMCKYDLRGHGYHHAPRGAGGHSSHTECGGTTSGAGCPECGWNRPP